MLQSVFEGKAAEIYSALPSEKSSDYDMVKKEVLKAYELVPEAYRQKFRSYKKFDSQTYVEFARGKEDLFDKWLTSKKTDNTFDNLRQLMLLEEFKQCVHLDLKTHLDDKTVESIHDAADISDNYTLSHKRSFKGQNVNTSSGNYKNQSTDHTDSKPVPQNKSQSSYNMSSPKFDTFEKKSLTCAYCKKIGHLMADCFRLQKKNERDNEPKTSACTTPYITSTLECPASQAFKSSFCDYIEEYKPFMSDGFVAIVDDTNLQPIKILRDTGASLSLLLEGVLPLSEKTSVGASVLLQGVELGCIDVPLHRIYLKSDLITGPVVVGVRPNLPVEGVTLLLGNDLARNKVVAEPIVTSEPVVDVKSPEDDAVLYPACVVTRAMARKQQYENLQEDKFDYMDLSDTFIADIEGPGSSEKAITKPPSVNKNVIMPWPDVNSHSLDREHLSEEQHKDPEVLQLSQRAQPQEEAYKVAECYYHQDGILMRKWMPPDAAPEEEWRVVYQVVVPKVYRQEIIGFAHDTPLAGHLGIRKTCLKILQHFYWPRLRNDVAEYCKSCHICQVVGKPNQKIPPAPLLPIPAFDEPFSRVLVDCFGPLPKTKTGNAYLLTIMCTSTRFPEAIPLRNIKTPTIVKALIKFFTLVGLPKSIQSDQGSNFMSGLFQQVVYQLGIAQYRSSAYHPESQGALERFHQTLKNMIRTFCLQFDRDWDDGVHFLLFAVREAVQESLGFSPFELVFGHTEVHTLTVITIHPSECIIPNFEDLVYRNGEKIPR
ncbi:uncharacterized protein LOC134692279 [Mytilus trossulus]|uniref:uncharacterized protein LOC134692279 n=1 Tax=Mytilus trossulus TaxID=6551 RepID=UPI003004B8E6